MAKQGGTRLDGLRPAARPPVPGMASNAGLLSTPGQPVEVDPNPQRSVAQDTAVRVRGQGGQVLDAQQHLAVMEQSLPRQSPLMLSTEAAPPTAPSSRRAKCFWGLSFFLFFTSESREGPLCRFAVV